MQYVLGIVNFPQLKLPNPEYVHPNLHFSLIQPALLNGDFPYFHMVNLWDYYGGTLPTAPFLLEPVAGILTNIPFLNMIFAAPLLLVWRYRKVNATLPLAAIFLILSAACVAVFEADYMFTATMRYETDIAGPLLLGAVAVWLALDHRLVSRRGSRIAINAGVMFLIAWGWAFSLAISISRYIDYWHTN